MIKPAPNIASEFEKTESIIIGINQQNSADSNYKKTKKEPEINIVEDFLKENFEFRRNTVNEKTELREINIEEKKFSQWIEVNEHSLARRLAKEGFSFGVNRTSSLLASDFIDSFNPIIDYFNSLKYDPSGPSNIDLLLTKITAMDKERFNHHFKKMIVRCVACSITSEKTNNNFNKHVFVIINPGQSIGKTSFIRWLCPPDLQEYFIENMAMDKDGHIALATNFIINLDELAGLSKHDINLLKSKISSASINERLPYGKRRTFYPRRANFFASTNNDEFLTDDTGNARWLCFEVERFEPGFWIPGNENYIDINKVWAEAKYLLDNGFKYQLTLQEQNENEIANQSYEEISIEEELITEFTEPDFKQVAENFKMSFQIREHLYAKGNSLTDKLSIKKMGSVLKKLKYPHGERRVDILFEKEKKPRKGFYIIFK